MPDVTPEPVRLTRIEVDALSSFLADVLSDPWALAAAGLDRRERAAVFSAAEKVNRVAAQECAH